MIDRAFAVSAGVSGERATVAVEAFDVTSPLVRACRAMLLRLGDRQRRSLGVISAVRGEGCSVSAAGFAASLSHDFGLRTALVELDFDHPELGTSFGAPIGPGLAELMRASASLEDCLPKVMTNLHLLSAGHSERLDPTELTLAVARSGILGTLHNQFDAVVAVLAPALVSASGPTLAVSFPQLLLVARAGVTRLSLLREAVEVLPAEPLVVLNGVTSSVPRSLARLLGRR